MIRTSMPSLSYKVPHGVGDVDYKLNEGRSDGSQNGACKLHHSEHKMVATTRDGQGCKKKRACSFPLVDNCTLFLLQFTKTLLILA